MEKAIYAILAADAGVNAIVGTRIYPGKLPQGVTLPAIVYGRITTGPNHASGNTPGLRSAFIQTTCYDEDDATQSAYEGADVLGKAVKSALSRYSGTIAGIVVQQIFLDDERDTYEFDTNKEGRAIDFICWYEET